MKETADKKTLTMLLTGSLLETYDYSLFGYLAVTLSDVFFPEVDNRAALILTFLVFAMGFITRPLGAILFGQAGDRFGRKNILLGSILLMAFPTIFIAITPSYAQIGITASVLFAISRLLQGLAVGGEFVGTMVYFLEQGNGFQRTFFGSLCITMGYVAMLGTAILCGLLKAWMSPTNFAQWGFRLPFLLGITLAAVGFYLRYNLTETEQYSRLIKTGRQNQTPLRTVLLDHFPNLLQGMLLVALHTGGFYLLFVYLNSYYTQSLNLPSEKVVILNMAALLLACIAIPFLGWRCKQIPAKKMLRISAVGFILFAYPIFWLLPSCNLFGMLCCQLVLTLFLAASSSVVPSVLFDLFETPIRFTGMALSYNLGAVIFGGSMPFLVSISVLLTENFAAPGICFVLLASISFFGTLFIKEKAGKLLPALNSND